MKAYLATVELSILIVGDELNQKFYYEARKALEEEISEIMDHDIDIEEAVGLPIGWDASNLVYGTDEDMTAEEALKLNQPPEPEVKDHPNQLYLFEDEK